MLFSEDFFAMNFTYARRVTDLTGMEITRALLEHTHCYLALGLGRDFDPQHPIWRGFLEAFNPQKSFIGRAYDYYRLVHLPKPLPPPEQSCGCFYYSNWRNGITLPDGRTLTWQGNKRSRTVIIEEEKWLWFDTRLTLQNYKDTLSGKTITYQDANGNTIQRQGNNLGGAFINSIAVAVPSTIIPILIAAFAAYGFAWMNFPGRKILFTVVVAMLVVPLQLALVPILRDYTSLGLNGTYLAMWLAHTGFGLPLAIYLLFNYIGTLPRDILESAFIDGASHFTIFQKLILPLSIPALASFAIFQFLWVWNDYLVALVFLGDKNRVVTSALAAMVGEKGQDWHLLTSGAFISMLLPLAVFFALQRFFVRGLMAGSVKG